ncbi:MAG: PRC-barrel domain-containing protein [Desulfohalobiaceae bacterium]|nr:PRC-barrel domain-containing protein [Desulfohalobiaceae bacterium]
MKRKLLVLIIGMMAMFLAATTFAAEKKSGSEYGDKTGTQMKEKSQTQMGEKSQSQMQEKSGLQKTATGMGKGEQFAAENLKNVEDIKGKKVLDANGEDIGEVSGMLVDAKSGKIKYIMLTSGGVFGVGGDKYPVPWQAVRTGTDQEGFQVNFTSEELKNAPKGTKVTSRDQAKEINEFYGVSPEWEESGQMGGQMKQDLGGEAGKKMDKESKEYQKEGQDKKKTY